MKRLISVSLLLIVAVARGYAASIGTCNGRIVSGSTVSYLTWRTETDGSVVISISGGSVVGAAFRGNGMARDAFYYYRAGHSTDQLLLTDSMTASFNSARDELRWTPKAGFVPRTGDVIHYTTGKYIEWKTAKDGNAYSNIYEITYHIGDGCELLDTPVIQSISEDGVISFTPVSGADAYMAYIYQGDLLLSTATVKNGGTIDFQSYNPITYTVYLQALGWSGSKLNSELSEGVSWTPAVISLPESQLCGKQIGSGTSAAYLNWQTNEDGDIVIRIEGDANTHFRANGMGDASMGRFMVGASTAATYFEREYYGDNSDEYILRHREDVSLPYGTKIKFSGTIEWKTTANTNAYGDYSMEYIYGTVCPGLPIPAIDSIGIGDTIYFSPVEHATEYVATIYRGALKVYTQTVNSGDVLRFSPYVEADYYVYLTAKAKAYQSATSDQPYIWHVNANGEDLPQSSVCNRLVQNTSGGIYLSIESDEEGNLVCTLSGPNNPTWRGSGLQTDRMSLYGMALANYYDRQGGYEHSSTLVLLSKIGINPARDGDMITYKGNVEWFVTVDGVESSPWVGDYTFDYQFGTTCSPRLPRLAIPVIDSVSTDGILAFADVPDAVSYKAYIFDADETHIETQQLERGAPIAASTGVIPGFSYLIRLQAWPEQGSTEFRESLLSEAIEWMFEEEPEPIVGLESLTDDMVFSLYSVQGILLHSRCTAVDLQRYPLHGMYIIACPTHSQLILLP
ncbi:MAG: hypothetical protein IKO63_01995 [Paludibacteraceae bacterium]|nr:hypothetical protein [Paludibacteraceae bacterium]